MTVSATTKSGIVVARRSCFIKACSSNSRSIRVPSKTRGAIAMRKSI